MKILIVDDKKNIHELLRRYLGISYKVEIAEDGISALKSLEMTPLPDLVITDLNMPHIDGFELITKLKGNVRWSAIPILVLSSRDESDTRIKCLQLGADDYLVKPFHPEELELRIQILIG